jgi:hypothetical protein
MSQDEFRSNPAAHAFVSVAQRYCVLLEHPIRDRDAWLADVLGTLATLYAAAPVLREMAVPEHAEAKHIPEEFRLTNDEWTSLYAHLKNTLGENALYAAHFNPVSAAAGDEIGQGDLADDLADIYRDIKPGLVAWNTGDDAFLEDVMHQWLEQGLVHHWGRHAVNAMRALHWLVYK